MAGGKGQLRDLMSAEVARKRWPHSQGEDSVSCQGSKR